MCRSKYLKVGIILLTTLIVSSCSTDQELPVTYHPTTDAYDGWQLGVQAWTFNRFTFYEAVDKVASIGLDWIEAYPGQKLSKENPEARLHHNMGSELQSEALQKLKDSGISLVNYGVVGLPNDEVECRKVFDFAKEMGIQTIVSEPPEDAFDLIDKLCQEYQINVAIHNHPEPSIYWNPDKVLEVCQGRSKRIGSCADTGHWMRSGINPLEALKKLEGRIISLHLKDLNEFGVREAHDTVWGSGKANMEALLAELHRQNFQGVFSIEYEYNWENSVPDLQQCTAYFEKESRELKPSGWKNLFADDLSNCTFNEGSWIMEDNVLTWKGGGYIWTKERYGDFILDMEYMVSEGANSGIFFRTSDLKDIVQTGIEVQIHETTDGSKHGSCGSIYDCLSPSKDVAKKAGLWNHYTITCKANKIYVVLNGEQIIDMDLNLWVEPHKNPDGTANKFKNAYKDMALEGHFGFQDHGQPVWFRNLKIKEI